MQCGKCGAENDDRAYLCAQCGAALEEVRRSELPAFQGSIPTYLVQAILVTIFCCQPFGIVSIVFAAIATSHLSSGNRAAAIAASNNAKTWCWVAFWCGLAWVLFVFFFMVLAPAIFVSPHHRF
ncbi:MAG: CD225/dispanin family protein [Thermoguttaceae bacterium]